MEATEPADTGAPVLREQLDRRGVLQLLIDREYNASIDNYLILKVKIEIEMCMCKILCKFGDLENALDSR